ncbi:MAG: hypothetical protein ABFQ62_00985 [Patescibacteria group bacterium]
MNKSPQIKLISSKTEEKYRIFSFELATDSNQRNYEIYVFNSDIPFKQENITDQKLDKFAMKQMKIWLVDSGKKPPKDKHRVLINGGKITTDNIENFLSIQKKTSDLVRTNVTISAPLFEWAKSKAQKENTSFSDLVSRGLLTLKDSDKEINAWFKERRAYSRKKLGDLGSFEIAHYLPNSYREFDTNFLKDALQRSEIRRTGWPIGAYLTGSNQRPHPQEDGIEAEYSPSFNLKLDYWYAKNKGEFYFSRNLESDSGNGKAEPKTSLYFDTVIWRIAEALEHCLAYYQHLDVSKSERVKIRISLNGLSGRYLSAWNQMRSFSLRHYTCGSNKSTWETEVKLNDLEEQLDDTIYEATKKILVMFDFFVPNKEVVFDILNREYRKSTM